MNYLTHAAVWMTIVTALGGPTVASAAQPEGDGGAANAIDFADPIAIANPNDHAGDWFGSAVAGAGTHVLAGAAPYEVRNKENAGALFLFNRVGEHLRTIGNPTPEDEDRFAQSLGALGQNLIVSAYRDDDAAAVLNAGAGYLMSGRTGRLVRIFTVPDAARYDHLGASAVAVGGDVLAFGATGRALETASGNQVNAAGAVYLFDAFTGEVLHVLEDPDPREGDEFGSQVADAGGGMVLIGAASADREGQQSGGTVETLRDAGEAYLFDARSGEMGWSFV
jgi:hypothetical protein